MDPTQLDNLRQLLNNRGWRLHFPAPLEAEFQADYTARYQTHMIISGLLGVLALLACGVIDPIWMPDVMTELWTIRIATTLPILVLLLFSRTPFLTRHMQAVTATGACIFVAGLVALSHTATEPFNHYYAGAITLVMLVVFVLSRLQFVWGLCSAALMMIILNTHHLLIAGSSLMLMTIHNFIFIASATFALVGTFLVERSLRQNYLQSRLLSFENHDLEESNLRLQYLTAIDGLTQIANRRSLDMTLTTEWQRALRKREPLGVVMIDVDHFKLFNDTYGHQAGDECLRGVAGALKDFARRPGDIAARYGGEEFVLVLTNATSAQARIVAERVRDRILELAIPHQSSSHGNVTASFGVASIVPTNQHNGPEVLLLAADQALYRAKHSGRNRVSVDGLPDEDQAVA
ncbi:MAG: diguanylate cyclase [Moraxellaceae bacterium]|nr:diguanylate cyclase [Moraxellaceae bacterium]